MKNTKKVPNLVTEEGWLVVDLYSKPVLDFPNCPLTLSSKLEGWLMEALLRKGYQYGMKISDIRARMPGVKGEDTIKTSTLSMRMNRFRGIAGCISWTSKEGSETQRAYLDALLPQANLNANSTRSFRNLHLHEVVEMSLINCGRFPNKARPGK